MSNETTLAPASELAARNGVHFPNESPEYRQARTALLAEEIELRRHIERVAALRRALPPGGEIPEDYQLVGDAGPIRFSDLFGDKQTLIVYSMMFGPQRARPCPVCTSMLSAWDGTAKSLTQLVALAVFVRSPINRILDFKEERKWQYLNFYSDLDGNYTRSYVNADDGDVPALNIFTRRDGKICHFWSGEMGPATSDPGQDPRGAPDIDPLWTILDLVPEGRGTTWYPKLEYTPEPLVNLS